MPFSIPQEAKIHRKDRRAVRKTIVTLRPSIPTKYSIFQDGTQEIFSANWTPGLFRSKNTTSQLARKKERNVKNTAVQRMTFGRVDGRKHTTTIPAKGKKIINVRI